MNFIWVDGDTLINKEQITVVEVDKKKVTITLTAGVVKIKNFDSQREAKQWVAQNLSVKRS